MERLAFGYGTDKAEVRSDSLRAADGANDHPTAETAFSGHDGEATRGSLKAGGAATGALAPDEETTDWAFLGLMAFTAMLFFRPQDLITPLRVLHLAELSALFALAAL